MCLDRNNDGSFELFVFKRNAPFQYLEFISNKLIDISKQIGIEGFGNAQSAIVIPNDKGIPSILVGLEGGTNLFYKGSALGIFSNFTKSSGLADPLNDARGISLIDFNQDGYIDIIYGNYNGPTKLFTQGPNSIFTEVKSSLLNQSYYVNSLSVLDLNLDGFEDLYLNNRVGRNYALINKGSLWEDFPLNIGLEKNRAGTSTLVGDIIFDGANELLIAHGHGEVSKPSLYTTTTHKKWVSIIVKNSKGSLARNALVYLTTNSRKMLRVISDGSSPYSSRVPLAHFGLNKEEKIISLRIIYNNKEVVIRKENILINKKNSYSI